MVKSKLQPHQLPLLQDLTLKQRLYALPMLPHSQGGDSRSAKKKKKKKDLTLKQRMYALPMLLHSQGGDSRSAKEKKKLDCRCNKKDEVFLSSETSFSIIHTCK